MSISPPSPFAAVFVVARELVLGRTLHSDGVSVGRGRLIDWRVTRAGDILLGGADAYDLANLFVALVGPDAARKSAAAAAAA